VTQGSFAKVGFSVPNERDDAGRTLNEPLGEEGSITEVVDTITWTATGDSQIAPGQFELFWISAGQMPTDVTELSFPAVQTYSSGEEVDWIERPAEGAAEPEHPAPTLQLVSADEATGAPTIDDAVDDDGTDTLSILALVVGAAGLATGITALLMTRRQSRARTA